MILLFTNYLKDCLEQLYTLCKKLSKARQGPFLKGRHSDIRRVLRILASRNATMASREAEREEPASEVAFCELFTLGR